MKIIVLFLASIFSTCIDPNTYFGFSDHTFKDIPSIGSGKYRMILDSLNQKILGSIKNKERPHFDKYPQANEITGTIDTIYFNSDSSKFFCHYILEVIEPDGTSYDGDNLIGYIDSDKAKVYHFGEFMPLDWKTYKSTSERMRKYFLGDEFKNQIRRVYDEESDSYQTYQINYSPDQEAFWNRSVIWTKGICLDGYYLFEINNVCNKYVVFNPESSIRTPMFTFKVEGFK